MEYEFDIENAIKSIFLYCMKDPKIQEELMKKCRDESCNGIEKGDIDRMEGKIDEIGFLVKTLKNSGNLDNAVPQKKREMDKTISSHCLWTRKEPYENTTILEKENGQLTVQLKNIEEEKRNVENENKDLRNRINVIQEKYQDYAEIVTIWENLKDLSDNAKKYITSLCESFNLYSCISLGRDEGKIEQLWDFLKNQALGLKMDEGNSDIEKLDRYFEFCLQVANSTTSDQGRFIRFELPLGCDYDTEKCIRTNTSKQIGVIQKTIIKGVEKNEKVIYKSIVEVR